MLFCFFKSATLHSSEHIPRLALYTGLIWLIAFTQISGDMATEHINGNGPEEPMDTAAAVTHSEHFQTLLEAGLPQKVAEKLDEIYIAGKAQIILAYYNMQFFLCLSISCMYCHFITFLNGGIGITKQLFVVSYQNGYCSATKY